MTVFFGSKCNREESYHLRPTGRKNFKVFGEPVSLRKHEAIFPGRVPHVRRGVHGPKMGRSPFQRCGYAGKKNAAKGKNRCELSESI